MLILSGFYLEPHNDERLERLATELGGRFIRSPHVSKEERQAHIGQWIAEADVLLNGRISEEHLAASRKLRWIHVPYAGVNSLLATRSLLTRDITITNASGIMADSVADQVMAYIIMLSRDLPNQLRAQQRHEWTSYETESPRRRLLRGRTVGILGYGSLGKAIATRARAFGMRVVAMKRTQNENPQELDALYSPEQLHDILGVSDFVVVTLPLTEKTRGLIGAAEFAAMKPGARFINVARGAIVDEPALISALESGALAAAALDVVSEEPLPPASPLWSLENVILTPHSSGGYLGYQDITVDFFMENLKRYARGEPLVNVVNTAEGY